MGAGRRTVSMFMEKKSYDSTVTLVDYLKPAGAHTMLWRVIEDIFYLVISAGHRTTPGLRFLTCRAPDQF